MRNKKTKGYLMAIDLDGVLSMGEFWGKKASKEPKPIRKNINLVNNLVLSGHHIVIYTSRREWWRRETEKWLLKHKVLYHSLKMGKLAADFYLDDKMATKEELNRFCNKGLKLF